MGILNTYRYRAISKQGAKVNGVVEAQNEYDAVTRIKEHCDFVTDIRQVQEKNGLLTKEIGSKKPKAKSLSLMCSQFSVLLQSGLNIRRVVETVAGQTTDKKLKKVLAKVAEDVGSGYSLAGSMENQGDYFPIALIETVRAGEESGALEHSFARLTTYYENSYKTRAKVTNALTYPIFVLLVATVVMIVMMAKVIPSFLSIFDDLGTDLPLCTVLLINSSHFFQNTWLLWLAFIAAAILFWRLYRKTEKGAVRLSVLAMRIPVLGKINRMNGASQFANTMSTLLSAGLGIGRALNITARVLDNRYLSKCTDRFIMGVEAGRRLGDCMEEANCYPQLLAEMTAVGEETGTLEETLMKIGRYFDGEVETATTKAISMLEPTLLVATAIIAGFIVVSLYLPMFAMYGAM